MSINDSGEKTPLLVSFHEAYLDQKNKDEFYTITTNRIPPHTELSTPKTRIVEKEEENTQQQKSEDIPIPTAPPHPSSTTHQYHNHNHNHNHNHQQQDHSRVPYLTERTTFRPVSIVDYYQQHEKPNLLSTCSASASSSSSSSSQTPSYKCKKPFPDIHISQHNRAQKEKKSSSSCITPALFGRWMFHSFSVHLQSLFVFLLCLCLLVTVTSVYLFVDISAAMEDQAVVEVWSQGFFQNAQFFEHIAPRNKTLVRAWTGTLQSLSGDFSLKWIAPISTAAMFLFLLLAAGTTCAYQQHREKCLDEMKWLRQRILYILPTRLLLQGISFLLFAFCFCVVCWIWIMPGVCSLLHFQVHSSQTLQDTFSSKSGDLEGKWWASADVTGNVHIECAFAFHLVPWVLLLLGGVSLLAHLYIQFLLHYDVVKHKLQKTSPQL
jgi:hypothetical protein